MKISHAGPASGPRQRRRVAAGDEQSAGGFARHIDSPATPAGGIAPAAPLAVVESVLAVQEVGLADREGERRRALDRGHGLLDELHALRLGLIEGRISASGLHRLGRLLESARPAVDDPRLAAVLDEIELRAAVELAKLERQPD